MTACLQAFKNSERISPASLQTQTTSNTHKWLHDVSKKDKDVFLLYYSKSFAMATYYPMLVLTGDSHLWW